MGGIQTGGPFEFFRYTPSIPAAAIFIAAFGICTIIHSYQLLRSRCWMMIPFIIGGLCETIGYGGRIIASQQAPNYTVGPFLLQGLLTIWGPSWFAASIYMCLGRIARLTGGEAKCAVRPSFLTIVFVSLDYIGLAIQGIGSGIMAAGTLDDYYTGTHVVVAGLAILLASVSFFIVLTAIFDVRMQRDTPAQAVSVPFNWRHDLAALYITSTLIFVRSTARLTDYALGNSGWLMTHEWTFFLFDSAPMVIVMITMLVMHPSRVDIALKDRIIQNEKVLNEADV